jgi:hypothetical protein
MENIKINGQTPNVDTNEYPRVIAENKDIRAIQVDKPDESGASHQFIIETVGSEDEGPTLLADLYFQQGPIGEKGVNGIQMEPLLAIVACRLLGFQNGPLRCNESAVALNGVMQALAALIARTTDRVARGVEGTSMA